MKLIVQLLFFLSLSISIYAQTDGISYQAVIIDPDPVELPGVSAQGNILPNAVVAIRFTVLDANNVEEYQEVHSTSTDQFGMINLMIGLGDPTGAGIGDFTLIKWDGTSKDLRVEIDFNGTGNSYVDMDRQELTFVPYAYHRDITATGTLTVDDVTDLNGELRVHGPTNLNSTLDVHNDNATNLSGSLAVGGATRLNEELTVDGVTNLNDSLTINNQSPTNFSGNITVEGRSTFNGPTDFKVLSVNGPSFLNGQVTINTKIDSVYSQDTTIALTQDKIAAYPLLVKGSKQGIAIMVNGVDNDNPPIAPDVPMSTVNNFISFWDAKEKKMWGRIEAQSIYDLDTDKDYILEWGFKATDVGIATTDAVITLAETFQGGAKVVAASTSSTACVGVGACFTAPVPSLIIESGSNLILTIVNNVEKWVDLALTAADLVSFIAHTKAQIGVSYQSGAGDYAEWLPKLNTSDVFTEGELVGIKNGFVTKNTWGVEKIMVVSTNPIVLGNMPQKGNEADNVKIAFMGQVPARIIGKVELGDYVLPSEIADGFGKAVHPYDMNIRDYKNIAGVVWSVLGNLGEDISVVNLAVGINTNDLSDVVQRQEEDLLELRSEYYQLKSQLEQSNKALSELVPGFAQAIGFESEARKAETNNPISIQDNHDGDEIIIHTDEEDIVYFEISREQIETAMMVARENYENMTDNLKEMRNPYIDLNNDSKSSARIQREVSLSLPEEFKIEPYKKSVFWQKIDAEPEYREEIMQLVKSNLERAMHTHKKYAHKFTDLKLKE